ncbi:acyl-CoA dehydrogenase family protein [Nostoc flagelliforme FACHB-838]|uniref:Acyl-CoA dehydrogenase family protein n=1 Tax=Nostoc flagelliforme FACHB-838 TaxID=2692904 RepID=A0ABR8E273_9NOSO|nr:acyl-CoA dehydrogenase family protein [Nostoc flagelliforme]MBD2535832.1 acyl-CoA dehydrogenase family protein [Nostoc flagelliforme FACHB-838]
MVQLLIKQESKHWINVATSLSTELAATAVERDNKAGLPDIEIQRLRETGLLPLVVPKEYGGIGATWAEALKIVQELSKADGSIGELYGNHLNLTALAHVSGTPEQKERYYRETAQKNLFWASAINTRDTRLKITAEGENFRVHGVKSFGTGVAIADFRVFAAIQDNVELPLVFIIPKDRAGVASNQDWDNIGQRRTDSDTFTFYDVLVKTDEILGYPHPPDGAFSTFLGIIAQLTKTYVYLEIAEGALAAAKQYTVTQTKPWITSGVDSATQDPYILNHYGNLWAELQAAISLADKAASQVQQAWDKEVNLTFKERGEVAVSVFAAKAFATRVALNLTTGIFEVMGTRSTGSKYGFDRYWRDLRTFTLHDPVDYKLRDIGNWVLNEELPLVTQYS